MARVKLSKKDRRQRGWVQSGSTIKMKRKDIINECLDPPIFWDDWNDRRDGFRDFGIDRTKILPKKSLRKDKWRIEEIKKYNEKQKVLLKIRKRRKNL